MIPGQHYNHDPRHFRFERQLRDFRNMQDCEPHRGDRFVVVASIAIAVLLLFI
jgi:hypothetical protein